MKRSIYVRLVITYLIYGVIAFGVIFTFTQKFTQHHMEEYEAENLYREAKLISTDYAGSYYDSQISLNELQTNLETLAEYLSADINIISPEGVMLLSSSNPAIAVAAENGLYTNTVKGFDITDFGSSYYTTGTFYGTYYNDVLTVVSTLTVGYQTRGYVLIHKPMKLIMASSDDFTNITFYTVLIMFLFAFVILILFTRSIYQPLRKITTAAKAYAKGDFSQKLDIKSNDELEYLANTLNYMATELDTFEEDQRKFVSNVSHDFRSPLTSIKGYVEAMLDGTIPVEMQDKYLNIILFETERLNKLTQSLIDLNQFGNHGIHLDMTDFDINGIIRSTILTFEGKCQEKNLSFDLVLTGEDLFVHGDMTKIQQILYNLIDNATKFSKPNSSIKIETSIKNEKLFVSVKDSGIGISKENLNKIWERFYKIDSSRGKDKRGSGLGLSIVKEIVQAHGEHINVISTEGVGTEFIFSLQLSKKES